MTITLGYWMIPLLLSVGIIAWNWRPVDSFHFGELLIAVVQPAMIPVIWCIYLVCVLVFKTP